MRAQAKQMDEGEAICRAQLPVIVDKIAAFLEAHKKEYLAFPYLNHRIDWNLVAWQQVMNMACTFESEVERILKETHFQDQKPLDRPFSVFGFVNEGRHYGGGWDAPEAENVCGFTKVMLENISVSHVKAHFHCGLNIARDPQIQLALRAIEGLEIAALTEEEKEHAAKAIECGYLTREGEKLYTQILVCSMKDREHLFDISKTLAEEHFTAQAQTVAAQIAQWIAKTVDKALLREWRLANSMAHLPIIDG